MKISFLRLGEGHQSLSQSDVEQYRDCSIDTLLITKNIQKIKKGAFNQFNKVKKIMFEAGSQCYEIEEHAFSCCFCLKSIIFPLSLKTIGRNAFMYCCSLKSICIPSSVQMIGSQCFYYCFSLLKINIMNENISLKESVFEGCPGVNQFIIGTQKYKTRRIHDRIALYQKTHFFKDKMFCRAIDIKEIVEGKIFGDNIYFIWTKAGFYQGYGKNLHEALDEYNFECGSKQLEKELGQLGPESIINMQQYRALTKDCKAGTEEFLISKNIPLDATMKISDVYALSDGHGRSYLLEKIMKKGSRKNEHET